MGLCRVEPRGHFTVYLKMEKGKSRNFAFTLNNYTPEDIEELKSFTNIKYIGWAEEVSKSGTPHLQGLACFKSVKTLAAACTALTGKSHVEFKVEESTFKQARDYYACNPDKGAPLNLYEQGVLPMDPKAKGEATASAYAEAWSLAEQGKIDEIDPLIRLKYLRTLEHVRTRYLKKRKLEDCTEKHDWYYGPTRTGKSRKAREELGPCYKKRAATKWWDGYEDGPALIEDFDKAHHFMGHDLKIWLDRYPFPAEVKGSQGEIRPSRIIVTSNYHPSEIWTDPMTLEPILARIKVTHFPSVL